MLISNSRKLVATSSVLTCVFSMVMAASLANAQSDSRQKELADNERASLMFDINVKKLFSHSLLKDKNLKDLMAQSGIPQNPNFDVTENLERIFGAVQIPEDPAAMQPQPGDDLKMNFFMRVEFDDAAAAQKMIDSLNEAGSKTYEVGGKTYIGPDGPDTPTNIRAHIVNQSTVEFGTERYVLLPNRNVVSEQLASYWKQVPKDSAIRFSVDLESNREVIDVMMEQAKATAPSEAAPYLGLVNDLSSFTLGMDFESKNLLTLRASGKDSDGTEKLLSGLNGMLGMGKLFGQQGLSQSGMDESSQKVFKELLSSLNAKSDGNTVTVDIQKPEGFDDVIGKMMGQ